MGLDHSTQTPANRRFIDKAPFLSWLPQRPGDMYEDTARAGHRAPEWPSKKGVTRRVLSKWHAGVLSNCHTGH